MSAAALWPRETAWARYIERIAGGDDGALAELYDESARMVYGLALRVLGNPEDAEEVTADVYAQVWRCGRDFDATRGSAPAWLVMLARSRAIDRLRSRTTRRRAEEPLPATVEVRDTAATPDQAWIANQRREIVAAALARLSPAQRKAVELVFFAGLSHSELAETLGEPLGTVKTRIRSAMAKLRESLAPVLGAERAHGCDAGAA
jgi:RNA polymerase sigma-70 factor (ECF subfamily)